MSRACNRAENSHQPTRRRERKMQRLKSPGSDRPGRFSHPATLSASSETKHSGHGKSLLLPKPELRPPDCEGTEGPRCKRLGSLPIISFRQRPAEPHCLLPSVQSRPPQSMTYSVSDMGLAVALGCQRSSKSSAKTSRNSPWRRQVVENRVRWTYFIGALETGGTVNLRIPGK